MATKKPPRATQLAAERRTLMEQIAALTKRKNEIDEALLALDLDETYTGDGVTLSFTPVRNIDTAFVTKKFPASKHPEFYKLTFDTTEFRRHFSDIEIEDFIKISHRIKVEEL